MVGPKHVSRKGRGRGSASLDRLRQEFHRFREEVGCIRSLPSLHRRWPSLGRLEIDSEASSEDGTLWDTEELPRGNFPRVTADCIDRETSPHNFKDSSELGLENSCGTHSSNKKWANVRTSPVASNQSSAKSANDGGSKIIVVQAKTEEPLDVEQFSLLRSPKGSSHSLGSLDTNLDNSHDFKGYDLVKLSSRSEDSARSQNVLGTLKDTDALPASQRNQEAERNCPTELLRSGEEDAADLKECLEDVGRIGIHLSENVGPSLSPCDVNQKLGQVDGHEEITCPRYVGGVLSFLSSRCNLRGGEDENEPVTYSSTAEGQTNTVEDPSTSSYDTNLTEVKSLEACFDDGTLDNSLSNSGARIAATSCFTANPHHKLVEKASLLHRHIKCQNDGSIQVDIPRTKIFTSANCREGELCNLHVLSSSENHIRNSPKSTASPPWMRPTFSVFVGDSLDETQGTDDEKDPKNNDTKVNRSSKELIQPRSPEDGNRTLHLVGYVYEEAQHNIAAQVPNQPNSVKLSTLPVSKSVQSLPVKLGNQIIHDSRMPIDLDARRQHGAVEEMSTINVLTPHPSQRNTTPFTTGSECDANNKPVKRQDGGISSLIALSGLQVLTGLDDYKRDSGLAARMATRIRHALESLGERSRVKEKCVESSATTVTGNKSRLRKGCLAGCRTPYGIGNSKVGKRIRFKIESDYPKPNIIGGDRHRLSQGWMSSDATGSAARSSDSLRPEEPESYLQHVIAALDSRNDSDVQEESDSQLYFSSSSEEAPKTYDNRLDDYPSTQSLSPRRYKEQGTNMYSSKPCNIAHEYHPAHGSFCNFHGAGCSACPLHKGVRACCHSKVQEEVSEQRHLNSGCSGSPKISYKGSARTEDEGSPRVVRNSGKNDRSVAGRDSANPQTFSVKINGPMVEIEVGEEPPTIIWTPRGQNAQSVAVRTSQPHHIQEQNTPGDAYTGSKGAATTLNGRLNPIQDLHGLSNLAESRRTQANEDPRVVRFVDPILPGKGSKSVRFHSTSKDPGQDKFYNPKQIHESFDRTVKSLARKAQRLGEIEAAGEAVAGNEQSARPIPYFLQGGEPSHSILKSSRGVSESDSEVQENCKGGQHAAQLTDAIRHYAPEVAESTEIKRGHQQVGRAKKQSILKIPRKQTSPSSGLDSASGVYRDKNYVSDTNERKEILEAAAAGLAHELQILMNSRTPEYFTNQQEREYDGSSASDVTNCRQRLRGHRPKKLPGHFRPKKQATRSRESPGLLNEVTGDSHSMCNSAHTGVHSLLAGVRGRDPFVHTEVQRLSQRSNSASTRRAKQMVRDTLGDVFDYDKFQQELGELVSERKRVEWLGRTLATLKPDAVKSRQKQDCNQGTLVPERTSTPRSASVNKKGPGSSGSKRHRSAISPIRESGKKMFRTDSGKMERPIQSHVDNQLFFSPANARHASFGNLSQPVALSLGENKLSAHNIASTVQRSRGLPKLQHTSVSRRPSHRLVTEFKSYTNEAGSCKGIKFPSLETNYMHFTLMEGAESDRLSGDQLAIKRRSLRPAGSFFKVATPVIWMPSDSTSKKGRKPECLSSTSILETCGTLQRTKSTSKPKYVNVPVRKEMNKAEKLDSEAVSQGPRGKHRVLNYAERPKLNTKKTSDFNSDVFRSLLSPSTVDLDRGKDSVLKPKLVRSKSIASKLNASRSTVDERATQKHSWSERMKAFLVSCGALLTETNTFKDRRQSEQPSFTSRRDVCDCARHEGKDLLQLKTHPMERKDGLVSRRLPKIVDDESRMSKPDLRREGLDNARNKVRLISGVETYLDNEKSWGSSRNPTRLRNDDCVDGNKNMPVNKTKYGKNISGQKKGHDLLLTMLKKVSTGISVQKQMVKTKSLQEASERKTKGPDGVGKYASALVSLKPKDRARLTATNRAKESKRQPKSLGLIEVKKAQDSPLIPRNKGESDIGVPDVKSTHANSHDNSLQVSENTEVSLVRRHSDLGIQFVRDEMKASVENWLNASGGFEFLYRADGETVRKSSLFRISTERTSLHSQSAEVGVREEFASVSAVRGEIASQDNISPVSCVGVQSGSIPEGLLSQERKEVHARRKVNTQADFHRKSLAMDKDTGRNENSSSCETNFQPQVLTDFGSDPVDSFIHVFQGYREKSGVRERMTPEVNEGGKLPFVDDEVPGKVNPFDFKCQKRTSSCNAGTRMSSNAEDNLTESEELELALLELVIKIVLKDDLIKNAKCGPTTVKEETSSLSTEQRKLGCPHVDQAVQDLVPNLAHDVTQISPTPQVSDSAKPYWPDYVCLAEKQSRSESCEEDGDWPEYLGLDDQGGIVEADEGDLPVAKGDYSQENPGPTVHGPSTMTHPLHASTTSSLCPLLPTNISDSNHRESSQFPGLSSLAFSCEPPPQSKINVSYIGDTSSTGVQTNDLFISQPLNPVYILPLYCLPDGRPFPAPYSMYPQYLGPEDPSRIHPMQIPPAGHCRQFQETAAISEGVRSISEIHISTTKEVQILENESSLRLDRRSPSSTSSDSLSSSPRTPSTPISSPEHEARVASALAYHRRRQKRPCSSEDLEDVCNGKTEDEGCLIGRKPDYQQLPVSQQESTAPARNHTDNEYGQYPRQLLKTSTTEEQLSSGRSICAASASTRKELDRQPSVYYGDSESSELAGSYDGSNSSNPSVYPRAYSELDVPFVGPRVKEQEKRNRPSATVVGTVSVSETRTHSPGETQRSKLAPAGQADEMRANLGLYSMEEHCMYRERDLTRWSGVARDPGVSLSEGEIDPGGLRSEGECCRTYSNAGFLLQNHLYTAHQYEGVVSEPGEVSTVAGQHKATRMSNSMEKSNLLQSLSEGEIRAGTLLGERVEMNTPRGSAEISFSD